MMKDLEDDLSCPICWKQLSPPVLMCKSGHNMCYSCKKESCRQCPVCRKTFISTPNLLLDRILYLLPKPCPHANKGCILSGSYGHRGLICQFRSKKCPMEQGFFCDWNGTGTDKDWFSHIESNHLDMGSLTTTSNVSISTKTFQMSSFLNFILFGSKFSVGDNTFFIYLNKKNSTCDTLVVKIKVVPFLGKHKGKIFCFSIRSKGQLIDAYTVKCPIREKIQHDDDELVCNSMLISKDLICDQEIMEVTLMAADADSF